MKVELITREDLEVFKKDILEEIRRNSVNSGESDQCILV